jgi:MFS family permease
MAEDRKMHQESNPEPYLEAPETMQMQRPLSKNIFLLGLVSLFNDASSEIIQPILPLFIVSLGGGAAAIGLIGGLSDGIPSILKIFSGYWSDKLGRRKPLVVAGYGASALSKVFLPFSASWQHVLALRTIERCGKGIRSAPRDAMICESTDKVVRGRSFGLHRAMDSTGAIIGSALAYLFWRSGLDFRTIILIAGVLALAALVPFMKVQETFNSPGARRELSIRALPSDLKKFIAIAALFSLGNLSYMFFLLRAGEFFPNDVGAPLLLYILFNIVYAFLAMPVGIWSDKFGRKNILTLGYALFAAAALGFSFVSSVIGLIALFVIYGAVYAMVDASERAFVSDLSSLKAKSTSLGIYYGATGVSSVISGLIAGGLWEGFSPGFAFIFGSLTATLASLALWRMKNITEIL